MMKKILFIVFFLPLLAYGQVNTETNTITVIGISEKYVEPDIAILNLSASETENINKESVMVDMENNLKEFLISLGQPEELFLNRALP